MDTLVQIYSVSTNDFNYNHHSISAPSNHGYSHPPLRNSGVNSEADISPVISSESTPPPPIDVYPISGVNLEADISEETDYYDGCLKYIQQMLMEEEDLENKPCMFHECSAVQAAEKSFYEVIGEKYPAAELSPQDYWTETPSSHGSNSSAALNNSVEFESNLIRGQPEYEPFLEQSSLLDHPFASNLQPFNPPSNFYNVVDGVVDAPVSLFQVSDSSGKSQFGFAGEPGILTYFQQKEGASEAEAEAAKNGRDHSSKGKKNHYRDDSEYAPEARSNKQLAGFVEENEQLEMFDKVVLCQDMNTGLSLLEEAQQAKNKLETKGSNAGRPRGGSKKGGRGREVVDLRSLLTQCAQAVASNDIRTAGEMLQRIRQHSSRYGDGTERLAYYFANAIEARLAGTGTTLYTAFSTRTIMAADILKAYQVYATACPFYKMSNIFTNKSIGKLYLSSGATRIHIIDFGILYGFQWPSLIQCLSMRTGEPPKLRITGIDLPQPGFRPAERIEATGRRLENYCKRFNVPFEYNAIAKRWDTIQLEDLKIDRDELIVVNSLYRLRNVPDETVVANSPRDMVLDLIRRINPDMFVHGVLNGTFNAPFFLTRFREALFHFSTLFDMFEATAPREDQDRSLFEEEIFARDAMNVIACEGTARVERPETYKQWQARNVRAGFRQLPLYPEIVKEVSAKVKKCYHKDFAVDEDSKWMLQGWKGRVVHALSCWKPVQK